MTLNGRDRQVVQLVARFGQLSSFQIRSLIFAGIASATPADRSLKRLTTKQYLSRIERRIVGGNKGGSGQYVYQLGPHGHVLYRQGRYVPARSINFHSLAIADSYITLLNLHRGNSIAILGMSNEPDCWVTIDSYELKPDLLVELTRPGAQGRIKLWLEVDMGTEGQRQIREKMQRYWKAYNAADPDEWPTFPLIFFVAVDEYRVRELQWIIEQAPSEAKQLFRVISLDQFSTAFS